MGKQLNSRSGYVSAMAVIIALALLTFFGAIHHVVQSSVRENVVIDLRDQSGTVAEAASQEVINIIRANPDLASIDGSLKNPKDNSPLPNTPGFADGVADPDTEFFDIYHRTTPKDLVDLDTGKLVGRYFAKAKAINVADPATWDNTNSHIFQVAEGVSVDRNVFHVVTEGWAVNRRGQDQSHSTAHTFVYLSNVGEYFCAVKGHLTVRAGAKLSTAKIYGRSLEFEMSAIQDNTQLFGAYYDIDYLPLPAQWPGPMDTGYRSVKITDPDSPDDPKEPGIIYRLPKRLDAPLVFPSINEQVVYYEDTIDYQHKCDFLDLGDLTPPSVFDGNGFDDTGNNRDHVYYCNDDVTLKNVTVRGQVIIVANKKVRISGHVRIADDGPADVPNAKSKCNQFGAGPDCYNNPPDPVPAFPTGIPSTADQLVIFARDGIEIANNWCDNVGTNLDLHGVMLVSPDAGLTYDNSGPRCKAFNSYTIDFLGAMYLSDQPELGIFKGGRTYRYLDTFRTDPPPVRQSFHVLKQFVLRKGS